MSIFKRREPELQSLAKIRTLRTLRIIHLRVIVSKPPGIRTRKNKIQDESPVKQVLKLV